MEGGQGYLLSDALLELSDVALQDVQSIKLLGDAVLGFRGEVREGGLQPGPAGAGEDVAVLCGADGVFGQGGVDAVLQGGSELRQGHTGAVELPLIADLPRWQPDGGEAVQVQELGQTLGVELVSLVDVAHHDPGPRWVRRPASTGDCDPFCQTMGDARAGALSKMVTLPSPT
jgi:hypothetical protein